VCRLFKTEFKKHPAVEKNNKPTYEGDQTLIYLELDEEIGNVVERVKKARYPKVLLIVPANAQILQSLVNLKILRLKTESAGKTVTLITKDGKGRDMAATAGLPVAESIRLRSVSVEASKKTIPIGKKISQPMQRKNIQIAEADQGSAKNLQELSREEIPLAGLQPTEKVKKVWDKISGKITAAEQGEGGLARFVVHAPSRKILFGIIAAAFGLLLFIVYIAVPTATISITPRADALSKVVNTTFIETARAKQSQEPHVVGASFFDFNLEREVRIGATGMNFEGSNASGTITIYNRSPKEKFIVPSRFLSQEGVVFRTRKAITIPRAIAGTPGSVVTEVEACEEDDPKCDCINKPETCQGDFVGSKGNIGPSFFIMPALPKLSPDLYWAESTTPMLGGVTKVSKYITEEDLEKARLVAEQEIQKLAREELKNQINQRNALEEASFKLLDNTKTILVDLVDVELPGDIAGQVQPDFAVKVTARVRALAYSEVDLRALLFGQLEEKVHPEKVLAKINFDAPAFRVEEVDWGKKQVKLAITIEGVEEYDLSPETAAGKNLIEKIRQRIAGQDIVEAEARIRNLPEVNNVTISVWPFWSRMIPELQENIHFRVEH
jgi:hypothetical protein